MNGFQNLLKRAVIILVVVFGGGWFLGGTLNLLAVFIPSVVSQVQCPPGSTVREEFKQLSFNEPGTKTLTFTCLDEGGNRVEPLSDAESRVIEYRIFYPAGVIGMALLVAAWLIRSAVQGMSGARADSSPT